MSLGFSLDFDAREIEKRKQRVRDLWSYKKVDHVPLHFWVVHNPDGYAVQEREREPEKNLRYDLACMGKSLALVPDDYIPFLYPEVGCVVTATLFGSELYWPENPAENVYVRSPIVRDIDHIGDVRAPDPSADGLMPGLLKRMEYFAQETKGVIPMSGVDLGGVLNPALDMMGSDLFYTALIDCPEKVSRFLKAISDVQLACYDLAIKAAGGLNGMTTIDFVSAWVPEGRKGFTSDDVCATIDPRLFREHSKPFNERVYARYGYGGMHNCGPHPCIDSYIEYQGGTLGFIHAALSTSKADLSAIAKALAGRAVAYLETDGNTYGPGAIVEAYREIMNKFVPTTSAVLCYSMDSGRYSDADIRDTYEELSKISREFASAMRWKNA